MSLPSMPSRLVAQCLGQRARHVRLNSFQRVTLTKASYRRTVPKKLCTVGQITKRRHKEIRFTLPYLEPATVLYSTRNIAVGCAVNDHPTPRDTGVYFCNHRS